MVFSRFIWSVLLLVLSIVATSVVFGFYLQRPDYPVTLSLLILLLIVETLSLFYYLARIRRDLLRLIHALRNEDPTLQFSREGKDPYFSAIHQGFNAIIRDFRLVRLDRETEHQFLMALVEHIQFGILALDDQGEVRLVNEAMLKLLRLPRLSTIEELEEVSPGLPDLLRDLSHRQESLKQLNLSGEIRHLIFLSSRYRLRGHEIILVSVRDISREMDRNELEAWQKLLRVLRHEILNSITPIRIIAHRLSEILQPGREGGSPGDLNSEETEEVKTGLDTIHRRASDLSKFLEAYSNLYRIPEVELKPVLVSDLFQRVYSLFRDQLGNRESARVIRCAEPEMTLTMDESLIEQVLINLVKNSLEATEKQSDPSIMISSGISDGKPVITVTDNGEGIPANQIENIFVPFYSTKEGGTGVGLSFCQHVMRLHHGQLKVHSSPGSGSEFHLLFPAGEQLKDSQVVEHTT